MYSKHRPKHENQPETNLNAANINTRNTIVSIVSPCSRVNENSARGFPQILLLPPTALSTFRAQKNAASKSFSSDLRDEHIARTFERSRNRSSNEGRCGERKHVARVYVLTRAPLLIYDDDDNDDDDGRLLWRLAFGLHGRRPGARS